MKRNVAATTVRKTGQPERCRNQSFQSSASGGTGASI